MTSRVVFVGLMGSGKTTAGRVLAEVVQSRFSDSDAWIEATTGVSGAEIARRDGVEELHRLEAEHLLEALTSPQSVVIAAAASVVDDPRCRTALERAFVVWLDPPVQTLADRTSVQDHRRDLEKADGTITDLHSRRGPRYAAVADVHLTGTPTTEEILRFLRDT